jgi:hypothetical protein
VEVFQNSRNELRTIDLPIYRVAAAGMAVNPIEYIAQMQPVNDSVTTIPAICVSAVAGLLGRDTREVFRSELADALRAAPAAEIQAALNYVLEERGVLSPSGLFTGFGREPSAAEWQQHLRAIASRLPKLATG